MAYEARPEASRRNGRDKSGVRGAPIVGRDTFIKRSLLAVAAGFIGLRTAALARHSR